MAVPLVSVIIPTKNSGHTILSCLLSIRAQSYNNIEIITVDNLSKDNTREIAKQFGLTVLKGPERSAQRNFGAKLSKGDYLLFVDSDMELTHSLISDCVKKMNDGYDAIIIPELNLGSGFFAKVRALERSVYENDDSIESARFLRRSVFNSVQGYDETLTGPEDFDLQSNVLTSGFMIGRIQSKIIHHEENLKLVSHLRKKMYYSKSYKAYALKHPQEAKHQFGLSRALKYSKIFAQSPGIGFCVLLLKGTEFIISKIGMLS
jgi:glycosyltransferase involved in cell wall biosynthesis